uniref:Cylindromatosis (turban tumor syndrome) 2 n=1 Tax=Xiphophorus couchianus TaxID=32473 RepID=A0A3B5MGN3_9TELE
MEPKAASKDRFFIVIRGKSRRGFCRGCIGRVEAETARGELTGLMYGCGSNAGSPKNGGPVKAEDAYPLTRHQAQLLLYISSPSRRLEMLCNPQLFSAICELTPGDLVVIRYKKGHVPGVVKNLMQIGKKESKDDLNMLGFQVEFPAYEESEEDAPPVPESEAASLFVGKMKGIQGHINSCYLDATLFQGFVPAQSVMNLRKKLGCETFSKNEKPEEFISVLFQKVLCIEPLLKLSEGGSSHGAYTLQIFLEKEQMGQTPTVQKLLDTSCMSGDIKFETMPSCLIIQMPRCGSKYKMFSHIVPSTELDVTDLLYNPRECFICGQMAKFECLQCLPDHKLQPGRIKQYCSTCNTQVHTHRSRCSHSPKALALPEGVATDAPPPRRTMQLFGVLCIQTSHFVSFVKYGPDPHSWLFFDSMADRHDDEKGYSVPEVRACPELGDFLGQPEEEQTRANPALAPELVCRLLCDSYMY